MLTQTNIDPNKTVYLLRVGNAYFRAVNPKQPQLGRLLMSFVDMGDAERFSKRNNIGATPEAHTINWLAEAATRAGCWGIVVDPANGDCIVGKAGQPQ